MDNPQNFADVRISPTPHPPPRPQTSAFETPLPPFRTSFMDGPLEASALLQRTYTAELNDKQLPTPRLHCLFVLICYKRITISEKCCPPVDIDCCQLYLESRAFWRNPGNLQQEKSYCCRYQYILVSLPHGPSFVT